MTYWIIVVAALAVGLTIGWILEPWVSFLLVIVGYVFRHPLERVLRRIFVPPAVKLERMILRQPAPAPAAPKPRAAVPKPTKNPDAISPARMAQLVQESSIPGLYLRRAWPIGTDLASRSWLGGLPLLPQGAGWPRRKDTGLPLHFLAQIDCSALPALAGAPMLPKQGLLLFFADIDDEGVPEDAEHDDAGRVIHIPQADIPLQPRPLPDDLPELFHSNGQNGAFARPGQRSFPRWPVTAHAIATWNGTRDYLQDTSGAYYGDLARAAFDREIQRVIGDNPKPTAPPSLFKRVLRPAADDKQVAEMMFSPDEWRPGLPWCGAVANAMLAEVSAIAEKTRRNLPRDPQKTSDRIEKDRAKLRVAEGLIASLAGMVGPLSEDAVIDPALSEKIINWTRTNGLSPSLLGGSDGLKPVVEAAMLNALRKAATAPELLKLIPDHALAALHGTLAPTKAEHILLGAPHDRTNRTGGSGVRLLCLDSDTGVEMMFGDCGVIEWWIAEDDLANGQFDTAYVRMAGS